MEINMHPFNDKEVKIIEKGILIAIVVIIIIVTINLIL